METIKAKCKPCDGTGLYVGFAEPKGTAVVCIRCGGSGCATLTFTPFTRRKNKIGINIVRRSRGSFMATGVGPIDEGITYQEFQKGKMP